MGLFNIVLLWSNEHRLAITLLVALLLWGSAYGIYFRRIGVRFASRGKPHSWQIDMVNKTATHGNRSAANNGKRLK